MMSMLDVVFNLPVFHYLAQKVLHFTDATSKQSGRWNYFNSIKNKLLVQIVHGNFLIIIKVNHPARYN